MLRKSTLLCFFSLAIAALLITGCSGPDAPPKKTGTGSGKSLTTTP